MGKPIEITAIKVSNSVDGNWMYVEVEYQGKWVIVAKEPTKLGIVSTIVESLGIKNVSENPKYKKD